MLIQTSFHTLQEYDVAKYNSLTLTSTNCIRPYALNYIYIERYIYIYREREYIYIYRERERETETETETETERDRESERERENSQVTAKMIGY